MWHLCVLSLTVNCYFYSWKGMKHPRSLCYNSCFCWRWYKFRGQKPSCKTEENMHSLSADPEVFRSRQELLLAATSHGLASCPMEGFDMRRLRKALSIPLRYSIPIVVCIGYPSEEQRDFKTLRCVRGRHMTGICSQGTQRAAVPKSHSPPNPRRC